ncbi:MAG: transcription initiation factor IIB [Candidatus Methanofastidiosia archaeon]
MADEGTKTKQMCPECGSNRLVRDFDRGELICATCGLVLKDKFYDMGPEWRAFDSEQRDKRGRVGAPMTFTIHDKGLSTMIDWRNKDVHGRDISPTSRAQIYRLRKWQRRIRVSDAAERNLAFAMAELDRISSHLSLPRSIREAAAIIYRKAVEQNLIRGRSIESVTASCIYAACRQRGVPRTLEEIAEYARVDKKEIGRSYRFIVKELNIRINPTNPTDYIPRFSSELGLSSHVQQRAIEIINQAIDMGLTSGRGPMGIAAAALYIASIEGGERRTQRDVSEVAKVTEVTVRNRYKELQERLNINIDV